MKRLLPALLLLSSPVLAEKERIYYVHVRPPSSYSGTQFAPTIFSMAGQTHTECGSPSEYLKWCNSAIEKGADALYCSGSFETVAMLSNEYIPVVGHVGLVPARATWTGGFKAVGKTANDALELLQQVKSYENAGAIGVELEVVPVEVADEISKRTSILVWSMGAGAGCDAQYLYSNDILGYTDGHIPRHAKVYRDFKGEFERLQNERVGHHGPDRSASPLQS